MELLKTYLIKPEQSVDLTEFTQMKSIYNVPVNNGDNGILLVAYSEEAGGHLYIAEGDGVFAGDEKDIPLEANTYTIAYLESGPFMMHKGAEKGHIRLYSDSENVNAAAIQLK